MANLYPFMDIITITNNNIVSDNNYERNTARDDVDENNVDNSNNHSYNIDDNNININENNNINI